MDLRPSSPKRRQLLASASKAYHEQMDQRGKEFLDRRGLLGIAEAAQLGVVQFPRGGHERYKGRLSIPYVGPRGNVYDIRYRCLEDHDCREHGHGKYEGEPGVQTRLFNVRALVADTHTILVAEGETDCLTLWACGWPAVGVPGANAWKTHHARCFAEFGDVVVIGDGDDAGRGFASKVVRTLPSARSVMMSAGEDVNSLFVREGRDGLVRALKGEE